jgi:hypothetical protein
MFRSTDLPWATPPGAATTPPPVGGIPEAGRTIVPEPAFVPEGPESAEKEVEASVFEEVLEEDLEFGPAGFAPKPTAGPSTVATVEAAPLAPETPTIPPIGPPSDEATTGAFTAVELEREPTPFATAREEAAFGSTQQRPPALSAETGKAEAFGLGREEITFEPELVVAPEPPRAPAGPPSAPAPPSAPESFADVAPEAGEPNAPPPTASEAAAVAVPVDMVEKIAQRVVAQISERVVREIAWDVIPDLAEALIKQEIERLKAELQKT